MELEVIHSGVGAFYCSGAGVAESWSECWERLIHLDSTQRKLIKVKGKAKGLYIAENRNKCVGVFLPWEPHLEWMLFVDTDVIFKVEDFYALYDTAVANHCDVLGGAYYTFWTDGKSIVLPWLEADAKEGWRMVTVPREELQDVIAVGMGFTLIHRRVLEAMRDVLPNHKWAWFGHDEAILPDGSIDCMGEDVTFCRRAIKLGFKVQGYSGITVGHQKSIVLNEQNVREQAVIEQTVKESA